MIRVSKQQTIERTPDLIPSSETLKFRCPSCFSWLELPENKGACSGPCPDCLIEIKAPDLQKGIGASIPSRAKLISPEVPERPNIRQPETSTNFPASNPQQSMSARSVELVVQCENSELDKKQARVENRRTKLIQALAWRRRWRHRIRHAADSDFINFSRKLLLIAAIILFGVFLYLHFTGSLRGLTEGFDAPVFRSKH